MLEPRNLGFPDAFSSFRDCQHEAFSYVLTSDKRFVALGIPPGGGKSAIAFGLAKLLGGRTIILTATHGLEDQYVQSLNTDTARLEHIRGRRNYSCWEGGNCDDGRRMGCAAKADCPYIGKLRQFNEGGIGITNYAYWLATNARNEGLDKPDTLVCDEAGLAADWLSKSLGFAITERQSREAGLAIGRPSDDIEDWLPMAPFVLARAYAYLEAVKQSVGSNRYASTTDLAKLRNAEEIYDAAYKLSRIQKDENNWIVSRLDGTDRGRMWLFQCVWPGRYKERLFQGIGRIILMSATLRPKTLQLLGIRRNDVDFKEWPRQFPAVNGPVIHIPTVNARHEEKMSSSETKQWIDRHAEIFDWGSDRKGITHTVSYARARQLSDKLGSRYEIVLNGAADPESSTAREAFEKHKASRNGSVLVSPSFSTGWDFSGSLAEFQIISKLAFPPPTDKLVAARTDQDRDYPLYVTAQELVQASGRINRYPDDRGTTLIVDSNVTWLMRAASEHMPKWFRVRTEETLPKPLDKI